MTATNGTEWLTAEQVQAILRIGRPKLSSLHAWGELPGVIAGDILDEGECEECGACGQYLVESRVSYPDEAQTVHLTLVHPTSCRGTTTTRPCPGPCCRCEDEPAGSAELAEQ